MYEQHKIECERLCAYTWIESVHLAQQQEHHNHNNGSNNNNNNNKWYVYKKNKTTP